MRRETVQLPVGKGRPKIPPNVKIPDKIQEGVGGMKLKIISDGKPFGTKVLNAETGEELTHVVSISISIGVLDGVRATIVIDNPAVELSGLNFGRSGQLVESVD